jgi:hypothetical protein
LQDYSTVLWYSPPEEQVLPPPQLTHGLRSQAHLVKHRQCPSLVGPWSLCFM